MARVVVGLNDLATTNPDVAAEWHPTKNGDLTPNNIAKGSQQKVWWLGKCGHEWFVDVNSRTNRSRGCPYCSGNKVLPGFNDLCTKNAELANQWNYAKNGNLSPSDVTVGSEKIVWWKCNNGHEWEASIKSRNNGRGCPYCSYKKVLSGFNDLATTHPDLASEWHPTKNGELKPTDIIAGTHKKIWWKCKNGHDWQATSNSRVDGTGCPVCFNKQKGTNKRIKAIADKGSLVDTNKEFVSEWHPTKNGALTPRDVTSGSNLSVWWLGKCGHEWKTSIHSRVSKNAGCPYCRNLELLVGFNDLATKYPDLAAEWHSTKNGIFTAQDVVYGSGKKVWWKCRVCNNEWRANVITRVNGSGCPKCSGERSTSYPEQAVYYYLKKLFPDAINRYVLERKELDIYIPSIQFGIEYDGDYYHTDSKRIKEIEKEEFFKKKGIEVIRIKELPV